MRDIEALWKEWGALPYEHRRVFFAPMSEHSRTVVMDLAERGFIRFVKDMEPWSFFTQRGKALYKLIHADEERLDLEQKEHEAAQRVYAALSGGLTPAEQRRVMRWCCSRLGIEVPNGPLTGAPDA